MPPQEGSEEAGVFLAARAHAEKTGKPANVNPPPPGREPRVGLWFERPPWGDGEIMYHLYGLRIAGVFREYPLVCPAV
jgi:hypothetical protein